MSLADEILQAVPEVTRRKKWFDYLPQEAMTELLEVRHRWQAGEYGPKVKPMTIGKLLVARCQDRGWETCDARRMSEWLQRSD